MGESTKAVLALLMIVGMVATPMAWFTDDPNAVTWGFRLGGPIASVLAIGAILKLHFRADLQPDYLRPLAGTYFNRDGFCFAPLATAADGLAYLTVYYQSQFDQPSLGRIALRPAPGFFLTRAKIDAITFEIDCPPAGFGRVKIALPIPQKLQGKRQSFEIGASVHYPDGKGLRVRFHDGIFLRSNTNFSNSFGTALMIAGAATGQIVLSKPATVKIELPRGVAETLSDGPAPERELLWKMGDPPLQPGATGG